VSENRFLHQFCALLGAVTIVCGTYLFLLATWNWDSATEVEWATPAATISIELSDRSKSAEPVAELEIAPATKDQIAGSESARQVAPASSVEQLDAPSEKQRFTASRDEQAQVALEDQPHLTAEARVGNQAPPTSANANLSVALEEQPPITAEARVGDQIPPASASANVSVTTEEQPPITAEALVGGQKLLVLASANVSAEPATTDNMADSTSAPDVTPSSSAETVEQATEDVDNSTDTMQENAAMPGGGGQISQPASSPHKAEAAEPQRPKPADNSSVAQETTRPVPDATQPQDSEADDTVQQKGSIATAIPDPQQSSLKAPLRKGAPPKSSTDQARPKLAANSKPAPKLAAKANQHEQTSQVGPRLKRMGSTPADKPSLSLTQSQPKRRDAVIVANEKPAPKLSAKPNPRQMERSQISPRWKPMALTPAEKPSLSHMQSQPKKPDARGYSANIWSALARRKPNAGQRASTTVTFAIGPAGALRFVRVSQSSGNARLDQLALATVRTAAPFPPPPVLKDGTAAYTIRIDFH
jgi:protein TonB